jgi:DnaJ-class molecular chaperone
VTPDTDGTTVLTLVLLVVTLGYSVTCAIWPFKACRRCAGTGRLRPRLMRVIRLCPRCRGTGLRIRLGRHAWNNARRLHRDLHDARRR